MEEYLQMGVGALEIFTRYVRNINQPLFASVYEKDRRYGTGI